MDRMPEVGDWIESRDGTALRRVDSVHGDMVTSGFYIGRWKFWEAEGWRIKEDNVAEWPNEVYQAVKEAMDAPCEDVRATARRKLQDLYREEEKRRQPQMCGAKHPRFIRAGDWRCQLEVDHAGAHWMPSPSGGKKEYLWYDPCEREHLTEAAQRVIDHASRLAYAADDDIHACREILRAQICRYDREARS